MSRRWDFGLSRYSGLWITLALSLAFAKPANATTSGGAIQGTLFSASGATVTSNNVNFKIQVLDKNASCVLYEELQLGVDLSTSNGDFSFDLGYGSSRNNYVKSSNVFDESIFRNDTSIPAFAGCASGVVVADGDPRLIRVYFDVGTGYTQLTPDLRLQGGAYAAVAETVQGKKATDLIQVVNDGTTALTQSNAGSVFSVSNFAKLMALLNGTSSLYQPSSPTAAVSENGQRITNVGAPTAASDASTKSYADSTVGGKSVDVTSVSAIAGNGDTLVWNQAQNKWVAGALALSGSASGDLTGSYPAPTIAAGVVTTTKIANDSITAAKIKSSGGGINRLVMTDNITGTNLVYGTCTTNQVYAWSNSTGWTCTDVSSISAVTSVAGKSGAVVLNAGDIGGLGTAAVKDSGTAAFNLVQLNSSRQLPAVDGSLLTGVSANSLAGRAVSSAAPGIGQVLGWNNSASDWEPVTSSFSVSFPLLANPVGSPGAPAYSFSGDPTSGFYESAPSVINVAVGGASKWQFTATSFGGAAANSLSFGTTNTSLAPSLYWSSSTSSGFYSPSGNVIAVTTSGTERLRVDSSGNVGIGTTSAMSALDVSTFGTGASALIVPRDSTANRAVLAASVNGMIRYNTNTNAFEFFQNGAWLNYNPGTSSGTVTNISTGIGLLGGPISATGTLSVNVGTGSTQIVQEQTGGQILQSGGAGGAPTYSFVGNTSAGLFSPGAGSVALATTGSARLTIDNSGNVGIGTTSPRSLLTVNGDALINGLTVGQGAGTGSFNTALGLYAINNPLNSGQGNVAIGTDALTSNTTGNQNVAVGWSALNYNSTGKMNLAIGVGALGGNTVGSGNIALGANTAGSGSASSNIAIGQAINGNSSLYLGTTGSRNVAIGNGDAGGSTVNAALGSLTSGSNNLALGYGVGGSTLRSGSNNILIGSSSAVDTPVSTTSNFLNLGNVIFATGMTGTVAAPAGLVGVGTTAPQAELDIYGTSALNSALIVPRATIANRPSTPVNGMIRYASDTSQFEAYQNGVWAQMIPSGGAGNAFVQGGNSFGENATMGTNDSYPLNLITNGSAAIRINANGGVGIGTTATPDALDVAGLGSFSGGLASGNNMTFSGDTATRSLAIATNLNSGATSGTNLLLQAGRAKAGASDKDGGTTYLAAGNSVGSGQSSIELQTAMAGSSGASTNVATTKMIILGNGNVGVGTTTPQALLDIEKTLTATVGTTQSMVVNTTYNPTTDGTGINVAAGSFNLNNANSIFSGTQISSAISASAQNTAAASPNGVYAASLSATNSPGAQVVSLEGADISATNASGGITGKTIGTRTSVDNEGTSINLAGSVIYVMNGTAGAVTANSYELYTSTTNSGTIANQWGIYQSSASSTNYFSGRIGVGTTTPQALLDVYGTGATSAIIVPRDIQANRPSTSVNGMIRYNTNLNAFEFYQNGAWLNYGTGSGGGTVTNIASGTGLVGGPISASGTLSVNVGTGSTQILQEQTGGQIQQSAGIPSTPAYSFVGNSTSGLYSPGFGTAALATAGTARLTINGVGNVGIGTTSPLSGLDIASLGTGASALIVPRDSTANRAVTAASVNGMVRYNTNSNAFEFFQNGVWMNYGTSNGLINTGTGATQIVQEQVGGQIQQNVGSVGSPAYSFFGNSSTGLFSPGPGTAAFANNGTASLTIDSSGNVGVGTSAPNAKLSVKGSATSLTNVIASGANVDLSLSNFHLLKAPGTSNITLSNPADGAAYTLTIADTTSRTYAFSGCTDTYFSPSNGPTSGRSTYTILVMFDSGNVECYVTWITNFN